MLWTVTNSIKDIFFINCKYLLVKVNSFIKGIILLTVKNIHPLNVLYKDDIGLYNEDHTFKNFLRIITSIKTNKTKFLKKLDFVAI